VFRDANPAASPNERYKMLVLSTAGERGLYALVSPDGLRWRWAQESPVIRPPGDDPAFDSPMAVFWDPWRAEYALYARGRLPALPESLPPGLLPDQPGTVALTKNRTVRRASSPDFQRWSAPAHLDLHLAPQPREQFYTNATVAYERARHLYFMFPMRYVMERKRFEDWPLEGLSDIAFLSSRDGVRWDRLFPEAWIRPGREQGNWHERSMAAGRGLVQTAAGELSLYVNECFRLPSARFVRYTVRLDGFVSANAPLDGGELVTPVLTFAGTALELNYATSILGSVQVEIQDQGGRAVPGFTLDECDALFGDDLDRRVTWQGRASVTQLAGQPVRLRFALRDADVFAFRFAPETAPTGA
jgi:hypothetical protein